MNRCSFLRQDFEALLARIEEVAGLMRALGADMGKACDQSSETFHDNFAYEDSERRQFMWGEELRKLTHMRDAAVIVSPPEDNQVVRLGSTVTVLDHEREAHRTFTIGSYLSFSPEPSVVSYRAPIAQIVIGAELGDICEGHILGRLVELEVLSIRCQDAAARRVTSA